MYIFFYNLDNICIKFCTTQYTHAHTIHKTHECAFMYFDIYIVFCSVACVLLFHSHHGSYGYDVR